MRKTLLSEYVTCAKQIDKQYGLVIPIIYRFSIYVSIALVIAGYLMICLSKYIIQGMVVLFGSIVLLMVIYKLYEKRNIDSIISRNRSKGLSRDINKRLRDLLIKYGVDYRNVVKVKELIDAYKEDQRSSSFESVFELIRRNIIIGVVPVVVSLYTEYIKKDNIHEQILAIVIYLLFVIGISIFFHMITIIKKDLTYGKYHYRGELISNLRDLIIFSNDIGKS